jgi:hypothetical protein
VRDASARHRSSMQATPPRPPPARHRPGLAPGLIAASTSLDDVGAQPADSARRLYPLRWAKGTSSIRSRGERTRSSSSSSIAGIELLVRLLQRRAEEPPSADVLRQLRASTERARNLIDGVLVYARAGELSVERVELRGSPPKCGACLTSADRPFGSCALQRRCSLSRALHERSRTRAYSQCRHAAIVAGGLQLATAQRATPGSSYPPSAPKGTNASLSRVLSTSRSPSGSPRTTIANGPATSMTHCS